MTNFQAGQLISNSVAAETLLFATESKPTAGTHTPFCPRGTGDVLPQKQTGDYILSLMFLVVRTKKKNQCVTMILKSYN